MCDPCGLVPFPAIRHRSQVRRIRLGENPVGRHEPDEVVVGPFPERDDPGERYVPAGFDRRQSQLVRAGITVQDSADAALPCLDHHRPCVVLSVARVNYERQA
jgi:hypothetical protein